MMNLAEPLIQDPAVATVVARAKQELAATGNGLASVSEPGKTVMINLRNAPGEAPSLDPATESLGTQIIEGVECEGTRSTFTIPAGQIGNELPIVITSERWYSPKLQTMVLSKRHDPRIGDTTFKLTHIDQSEPSASLFRGPPGFSVTNMAEKMKAVIREKDAPRK